MGMCDELIIQIQSKAAAASVFSVMFPEKTDKNGMRVQTLIIFSYF